jgi:membrane-associated phospholipid phosphatase
LLVALTEFGDAAVLLPLAATIGLWLLLSGAIRAAGWWGASVILCGGVTAALKIFFWGCPPIANLHSPSGHTSLGTLVYGAAALMTATEGGGWRQRIAVAVGACFVLAIGLSRLLLDAHSVPEVLFGWLIGGAALVLFGLRYRRCRPRNARLTPLFVGMVVLASLLHGNQLRAEELLHRITGYLGVDCGG